MANKFSVLRSKLKPESFLRAQARTEQLLAGIHLNELRQAQALCQMALAEVLSVQQPSIANLESDVDLYISTLRTQIQALGGDLEIIARFPHGSININNFSDLET